MKLAQKIYLFIRILDCISIAYMIGIYVYLYNTKNSNFTINCLLLPLIIYMSIRAVMIIFRILLCIGIRCMTKENPSYGIHLNQVEEFK